MINFNPNSNKGESMRSFSIGGAGGQSARQKWKNCFFKKHTKNNFYETTVQLRKIKDQKKIFLTIKKVP